MGEFEFVRNYYEKNNPGFQARFKGEKLKAYKIEAEKIEKDIARNRPAEDCVFYLSRYVRLLEDHHSYIEPKLSLQPAQIRTQEQVDSVVNSTGYRSIPVLTIDSALLAKRLRDKKTNEVEGFYTDNGGKVIAVFENENKKGSYTGMLYHVTQSKLYKYGQVLFDIRQAAGNIYDITYRLLGYNKDKICITTKISEGRIAEFGLSKPEAVPAADQDPECRILDDSTVYVRVPSFDGRLYNMLDTFYNVIWPVVITHPYLMVDIRNNGGGSDQCFYNLLAPVYSRPMQVDTVDVWVTPDNIKRYEDMLAAQKKTTPPNRNAIEYNERLIKRMKTARPNSFIMLGDNYPEPWALDTVLPYPRKVGILYDGNTASSSEAFILYARQSDKVITVGEHSGGYLGFGNVMTLTTPCGGYVLSCTTTRYRNQYKYEFKGIEPMYPAPADADWIEYTRQLLSAKGRP